MSVSVLIKHHEKVVDFFWAQNVAHPGQHVLHFVNIEQTSLRFIETRKRRSYLVSAILFIYDFGHHQHVLVECDFTCFLSIILINQKLHFSFSNQCPHRSQRQTYVLSKHRSVAHLVEKGETLLKLCHFDI